MRSEASFSSMSFTISGLQVTCGIEQQLLKIKVTPAGGLKPVHLALSKVTADSTNILFSIAQFFPSSPSNAYSSYHPLPVGGNQSAKLRLEDKLTSLENTVKLLQEKILSKSQSRRELRKSSSNEGRFGGSGSRSNLGVLPSVAIRENEQVQYAQIIQEEVQQNAKLQLLNDLLQEKILEKESVCLEVEKRLLEREELIRELADKLIIANIEKEDISNEYEKILQNNVFHRMEESPVKLQDQLPYQQPNKHETPLEQSTNNGEEPALLIQEVELVEKVKQEGGDIEEEICG